jgi:hypothetical protein
MVDSCTRESTLVGDLGNSVEHAADSYGYWGSRGGREFESRPPDSRTFLQVKGLLGWQAAAGDGDRGEHGAPGTLDSASLLLRVLC